MPQRTVNKVILRAHRTAPVIPALALLLALATSPIAAQDQAPPRGGTFDVGLGMFNLGHSRPSAGVGLEYRLDSRRFKPGAAARFWLVPVLGVTGSSKDALFGYAGLRADFDVTRSWRLTPGFATGAYERNGDIDLGGPVEFRSSLDVSRSLPNGMRVGVTLYHLSNARLYARNPGINALAFVQTF